MKGVLTLALAATGTLLYAAPQYLGAEAVETDPVRRRKQIADQINSLNLGWTASAYEDVDVEFPPGIPDKGMVQGLGAGESFPLKSFTESELNQVPDSFQSRDKWPNCESIRDIRNQSKCGSCWAFSSATVFSDRLCIASGQKIQTRLAPQDVLSCCFSCGFGCGGGYPNAAWFYFIHQGLVSGNDYGQPGLCKPYTITNRPEPNQTFTTPQCKRTCENGKNYLEDKVYAKNAYILTGEAQFKAEISTNGPIVASFTTYEDYYVYKSGIYSHQTGKARGGHAVRIVGYGEENGVKYWTIANTSGDRFGENGYVRIRRGTNECGIEMEAITGTVEVPASLSSN